MIGLKYLYAMLAGAFSGQPALNLRGQCRFNTRNLYRIGRVARIEAALTAPSATCQNVSILST